MKTRLIRIAIDGPGGAGKSSIAKNVAKILNIDYIDTGAMYRAIGYKIFRDKVDMNNIEELNNMLLNTDIDFINETVYLDGNDVDKLIRTPEMSLMASKCSSILQVREKLVAIQRHMGEVKSVIMDGRDIGTNVLVNAEVKIFMTASPEERAKRRFLELKEKGVSQTYEEVLEDIIERDRRDTTRKLNPLVPAEDSVILDTTGLNIKQVTQKIIEEVEKCQ